MADYEYIKPTGVIVPDTSEILIGVQDEYKAAFGENLVLTPDTPQGVLITAEALARDAVARNNAALANQINPNLAEGAFLDALCALTGLVRTKATRSTVTAQLTGVANTVVPAGVRAKTATGNLFELINSIVIPVGGTIDGFFQSVEYGPVDAIVNALDDIVDGVLGWESVNNADAAILGQLEQSDQSLRQERRLTLALQGVALSEAITSALTATEGVRSLTFRENTTGGTLVIDGITLVEHSIFVCVDGGSDIAVATTLLANKSLGCNWNGTTSQVVIDPVTGQEYTVLFERPAPIAVIVKATVKVLNSLVDPTTAVKSAILNYAAGNMPNEVGLTVGTSVSPFELSGAINHYEPSIYVQKVEIKITAGSYSTNEIAIGLDEIATIAASDINVEFA